MSGHYVLAGDIGSGGCKTVLLGSDGRVVASARQPYPTQYPQPGWVEQYPEDWYAAFCATTRAVLAEGRVPPERIAGVGIDGVTHNTVLLDAADRPLCPTILLFDNRSTAEVQAILARWGDAVREQALNDVTTVWTWPQLQWIRDNRPEVWRATRRILFQKDYVRHRLAPSPVTDTIDAEGTLLFDPEAERWIEPFCQDLGIDPSWLPAVVPAFETVASVGRQGAADTGLRPGTPVIAGTTDTVAEVLGAGAVRAGAAVVKLASVGRIAVVSAQPVRLPRVLNYRHVLDGLWYPGTASKYAASAFRWLRETVWPDSTEEGVYPRMDESADRVPPGADGLLFHPHLLGEWAPHWDEGMRGDFLGLTVRHTRGHLTRAVLEGVAFALKDALAAMEATGHVAEEIRLIGQGARSDLWAQIVANVLNRPLAVPEEPEASFGIALITAMGVGVVERSASAVESLVRYRTKVDPQPNLAVAYAELFSIYRDADAALQKISGRLGAFEQRQIQRSARLAP